MQKVIIVDDSKLFRKALRSLISTDFEVVGEAADGNEGIQLITQLNPDVILLDLTMPNCDGKQCLKKVITEFPNLKIVMISALENSQVVEDCLKQGALGYINKSDIKINNNESREKVINRIKTIIGGQSEVHK